MHHRSTLRVLWVLLALGVAADGFGAAAEPPLDAPPAWLQAHMAHAVAGGAAWRADNSAYRSEAEPWEAYGLRWQWGPGRTSMTGRLYGIRDGKEDGTSWEFRAFWHPGERKAFIHQYGAGGAVGIGTLSASGDAAVRSEQTFFAAGEPPRREAHDYVTTGPAEHRTTSFAWADGAWQPRRTYVWRRESGMAAEAPRGGAAPDRLFIAHFSTGPAWQAGKPAPEQRHFAEHSANLKRLRAEGRLVVGARYADKGMIVVKAGSLEQATALFAADPMVAGEAFLLRVDELRPFYPGTIGPL